MFESTLEKIARILGRNYNIDVVFEGNVPKTDGKKIHLPMFEKVTDEIKQDLHGYLDHEVGHCKFTDMPAMNPKKHLGKMHTMLLQNVEDVRIEREMVKEFPGTIFNLQPLNEKLRGKMNETWKEMPWPVRTIIGIRDLMEGRSPKIDADTERYIDVIKDAAVELRNCETTEELRASTEVIIKKIIEENEEEQKENEEGDGEGEGEKGEGGSSKPKAESDGKDDGDEGGEDSGSGDSPSLEDKMLTAKEGSAAAKEMEKHITDVATMFKDEIKDHIKKEEKKVPPRGRYDIKPDENTPCIPVTTRFDKVTDHSGKGNKPRYAQLKREVGPLVAPIKYQLERVLKVKENAKWTPEKERGAINSRSLASLASNKAYRTVFKEFSKTETNNVAVEVLVDMSGSMSGSKIRTAKMTAIAMAEAMRDLDIPFEVTGFYSESDRGIQEYAKSLGDTSRFVRQQERLDLHVFKSFDCASLTGIEEMEAHSNNPDGECLKWAAQRLAKKDQKRKILMVISDGQPAAADGSWGALQSDLRRKIKEITKGGIEVIGIGIETSYVKEFYPDYIVLNNEKELPKQAMGKLAKLISDGAK